MSNGAKQSNLLSLSINYGWQVPQIMTLANPIFQQIHFWIQISSKSIFHSQLCQPGGLNKDPTVWLDGARPPPIKFNCEFDKVIILWTWNQRQWNSTLLKM